MYSNYLRCSMLIHLLQTCVIFLFPLYVLISPSHTLLDAAAAKLRQSCPTLCDPTDGSPTGSSVPGILQARILEWVAIPFSNAWKWKAKVKSLSRVWLCATPQTAAHPAPPSMGLSRQEYWSGVPLPSPTAWWEKTNYLSTERIYFWIFNCCICVYILSLSVVSYSWRPHGLYSARLLSVHGIFQARILEWGAISSFRGSSRPRDITHISCIGRQILYHWATWETPF